MTVTVQSSMSPEEAIERVKRGESVDATIVYPDCLKPYIEELEATYREYWQVDGAPDVISILRDRHGGADLFNKDTD